jgi:hypothetical protein
MGMVLVREPAGEAVGRGWTTETVLDLVAMAAVPVTRPIEDPRNRRSLRLRLSGIDMERVPSDEQQERRGALLTVTRANVSNVQSYLLPYRDEAHADDLLPTPFLQSDHPRVQATVREILAQLPQLARRSNECRRRPQSKILKSFAVGSQTRV